MVQPKDCLLITKIRISDKNVPAIPPQIKLKRPIRAVSVKIIRRIWPGRAPRALSIPNSFSRKRMEMELEWRIAQKSHQNGNGLQDIGDLEGLIKNIQDLVS